MPKSNEASEQLYRVDYNETVGRHLLASRSIRPLELILTDTPTVSGPDKDSNALTCPTCHQVIGVNHDRCHRCRLVFCSPACAEDKEHLRLECTFLRESSLEMMSKSKMHQVLQCLLVLRLLSLHRLFPEETSSIMRLMSHNEERALDKKSWQCIQRDIVDFIRSELKLDTFPSEQINLCVGIIRTNAIACRHMLTWSTKSCPCRALLPTFSLLSHACVSNSRCVQRPNLRLEIRAQSAIAVDTEITIQYTSMMGSTRRRRRQLKDNWCFECQCRRCRDPTELGTHVGSLLCQKQECKAVVMAKEPLNFETAYKCEECDYEMTNLDVAEMEDQLEAQIDGEEAVGVELVTATEHRLESYKCLLHPHHYLLMRLKSILIAQYGNVPGLLYRQLDLRLMQRKKEMCEEFLRVFDILDPGESDWRASTIFELAAVTSNLAQLRLQLNQMAVDEFVSSMDNCQHMLNTILPILKVEEETSYLHSLANHIENTLIPQLDELTHLAHIIANAM